MQNEIGDMHPSIKWKGCGESFSMEKETILCGHWRNAHRARICETSFSHVDLDWKEFVRHDPRYERPAEVDLLIGDPSKAKKILGWEPKVRFHELVRIMVDADMALLSRETSRKHLGQMPVRLSPPTASAMPAAKTISKFRAKLPTSSLSSTNWSI